MQLRENCRAQTFQTNMYESGGHCWLSGRWSVWGCWGPAAQGLLWPPGSSRCPSRATWHQGGIHVISVLSLVLHIIEPSEQMSFQEGLPDLFHLYYHFLLQTPTQHHLILFTSLCSYHYWNFSCCLICWLIFISLSPGECKPPEIWDPILSYSLQGLAHCLTHNSGPINVCWMKIFKSLKV